MELAMFERRAIKMVVLQLLLEDSLSGSQIAERIEQRSNKTFKTQIGVLLPMLLQMRDEGLVKEIEIPVITRQNHVRHNVFYHITPWGCSQLSLLKWEYDKAVEGIEHMLQSGWEIIT